MKDVTLASGWRWKNHLSQIRLPKPQGNKKQTVEYSSFWDEHMHKEWTCFIDRFDPQRVFPFYHHQHPVGISLPGRGEVHHQLQLRHSWRRDLCPETWTRVDHFAVSVSWALLGNVQWEMCWTLMIIVSSADTLHIMIYYGILQYIYIYIYLYYIYIYKYIVIYRDILESMFFCKLVRPPYRKTVINCLCWRHT